MKKFFLELDHKLKHLMVEKNCFMKIGIGNNTDDDLPLNKPLKFPALTIIIRCIFQEGKKMFVWVIKMLQYDKINIDKTSE